MLVQQNRSLDCRVMAYKCTNGLYKARLDQIRNNRKSIHSKTSIHQTAKEAMWIRSNTNRNEYSARLKYYQKKKNLNCSIING